jgi:CHAP domain
VLSPLTTARRQLRALALAAALASLVGVFAPLNGSAASPPSSSLAMRDFRTASVPAGVVATQGSGSGFCGSVSGSVLGKPVQGTNLGPSFNNVYACGPTENTGWSNDPFESDFQCVELSTRFMWAVYSIQAAPGDGAVFVANNHIKFPNIAVGTPSLGSIPAPGDVVSLSGGPNAEKAGHTAVVSDVSNVNLSTGNGYITVIEENDGGPGTGRINVSNWSESMGSPSYLNGLFYYPNVSWLELTTSFAPSTGGETRVCSTCTPPLLNPGGPEMGPADTVDSLYWSGSTPFSNNYESIIDGYLTNVASNSPATNVYGSNPQYSGSPPPTAPFSFAGRLSDSAALPTTAGCATDPGYSTCLNDPQIQNEVTNIIDAQGSSLGLSHLYVMFLPPGVETCSSTTSCSASSYCGYHSSYAHAGGTVLYAVVAYPTAAACTTGQSPDGDPLADGAIDTLSHQLNEAITDPLGNAWTDSAGNEIGDLCANLYGAPLGSSDASKPQTTEYNQLIGTGRYYTQEEFSNAAYTATGRGCIQDPTHPSSAAANSVTAAVSPAHIPNDGASTATVTAAVKSAQHLAVNGDTIHFATYSRSGTCGTVSPTEVTADTAGNASTTFTASTTNATCTVIATESATGQNGLAVVVQGIAGVYHPLTPVRVADSRVGSGLPLAGNSLGAGQTATLQVVGSGVPSGASAAVFNVTVTNATAASYLTVYPGGAGVPLASNLNFAAGQTVANLVTVPIGVNGVSFFNHSGRTDVVVDLQGYFDGSGPAGAGLYNSLVPARVADTRAGSGQPNSGATLHSGSTLMVQVRGAGGVPAAGASAVILNVTAVDPTAPSFLTAYPSNAARPLASNLNFLARQVVPNRVMVPLGADGRVAIYNHGGSVDVVVDVSGWFTDNSNPQATGFRFTPIGPTRVVDTRTGSGQALAGMTLGAGGVDTTSIATTAGLPADTAAVAGNVTVANAAGSSFLTVYPLGAGRPTSSDLNWVPGEVASNMLLGKLGSAGSISFFNASGHVDVVIDVCGFWS